MNLFAHKYFTSLVFGDDLLEACVLPDEDENQNGYSCHFYNPVTGKCYRGTEDSARNRFIWHLASYLMSGSKEELGRSIHFLEDMCTPVHTQYEDVTDATIRLKLHMQFEQQFDEFLSEGTYGDNDLSNRYNSLIKLSKFNLSEILDYCPCKAAELYYKYRDENLYEKVFIETSELVVVSLSTLKAILDSNSLVGKEFQFDDDKINAIFCENMELVSCLNTDVCLRRNGHGNVVIFKRANRAFNFKVAGEVF